MACKEESLLLEYLTGDLDSGRRGEIEQHLADCQSCAGELEDLSQTMGALNSWAAPEVPPQLMEQTLQVLEQERQAPAGLRDKWDQFVYWLVNLSITPVRGAVVLGLGFLLFLGLRSQNVGQVASSGSGDLCRQNIVLLGEKLEKYRQDHQGRPPESLNLLRPEYLETIPTCPGAGFDTYSFGYEVEERRGDFEVYCKGNHHRKEGWVPDSPRYSSRGDSELNPQTSEALPGSKS